MEQKEAQEYKERSKNHFEKTSSHYSDTYAGKYTAPIHDALVQELNGITFTTLLDVGCGTGTFLSKILNIFGTKVAGIDISAGMIEKENGVRLEHYPCRGSFLKESRRNRVQSKKKEMVATKMVEEFIHLVTLHGSKGSKKSWLDS